MIETLDDYVAQSCCCAPTLCPIPVQVCESLTASFNSEGYWKEGDTTWKIYRKKGKTTDISTSGTDMMTYYVGNDTTPTSSPGEERSTTANIFYGTEYERFYEGWVGSGEDCPSFPNMSEKVSCSASGTSSSKSYIAHGGGSYENYWTIVDLGSELKKTISDVSGLEPPEHSAWETKWTDDETWQSAHDSWKESSDARAAWEADPESGEEPPVAGEEPPPRPAAVYPPCTYKVTLVETVHAGYWGYDYNKVSTAPPKKEPLERDADGEPRWPGSRTWEEFSNNTNIASGILIANSTDSGMPIVESEDDVTEPITHGDWMALVEGVVDAVPFPSPNCMGDECVSRIYKSPEQHPPTEPLPEGSTPFGFTGISFIKIHSRVRFQIPATWSDQVTGLPVPFTGTFYVISYDVLDEPDGWDDTVDDPDYVPPEEEPEGGYPPVPQKPKDGRPARTFFLENQILEWTGPGTGEPDDESWFTEWVDIPPPSENGTRRIVNKRLVCRENWGLGLLPQVWGEAVELIEP